MGIKDGIQQLAAAFPIIHGRPATESELLILGAHAMAESNFGEAGLRNWSDPNGPPPKFPKDGGPTLLTGHHNWGMVHFTGIRPGVKGSLFSVDTDAAGKPYRAEFNVYDSPEAGAQDYVKQTTGTQRRRAEVLPVLASRDAYAYARAQHGTGYFALDPGIAGQGFHSNATLIARTMGWAPPVIHATAGTSLATALGVAAIGGFVLWYVTTRKD
jgi:hypothetical protein